LFLFYIVIVRETLSLSIRIGGSRRARVTREA
jgi:hypothetical protein